MLRYPAPASCGSRRDIPRPRIFLKFLKYVLENSRRSRVAASASPSLSAPRCRRGRGIVHRVRAAVIVAHLPVGALRAVSARVPDEGGDLVVAPAERARSRLHKLVLAAPEAPVAEVNLGAGRSLRELERGGGGGRERGRGRGRGVRVGEERGGGGTRLDEERACATEKSGRGGRR